MDTNTHDLPGDGIDSDTTGMNGQDDRRGPVKPAEEEILPPLIKIIFKRVKVSRISPIGNCINARLATFGIYHKIDKTGCHNKIFNPLAWFPLSASLERNHIIYHAFPAPAKESFIINPFLKSSAGKFTASIPNPLIVYL